MTRFAWLMLLCALLFSSHGIWMNDEQEQANAFWHLSRGSLRIVEYPEFIYHADRGGNLTELLRIRGQYLPVGSLLLNSLALPMAALVFVTDAIAPLWLVFSGLAVVAAWKAFGWRAPSAMAPHTRWLAFAAAAGLLALASHGFRAPEADVSRAYVFMSLQLVDLSLWGLTGYLLSRILVHLPTPGRRVLVAAFLLGPMLFWGEGIKYHALTAFLATFALWTRTRPRTAMNLAMLGAAAGLLFWTHQGPGTALVVTIALLEVGALLGRPREWRAVLVQWVALLGAFMLALVPFFVENHVLTGNPFLSPRIGTVPLGDPGSGEPGPPGTVDPGTGTGPGGPAVPSDPSDINGGFWLTTWHYLWGTFMVAPKLLWSNMRWEGSLPWLANLGSLLTTGSRVEGRPLGIWLVAPWLSLAAFGIAKVAGRRVRHPATSFAAVFLLLYAVLMTNASVEQGGAFDVRMWLPTLPAFAVLASWPLSSWADRLGEALQGRVAVLAVAVVTAAYAALALATRAGWRLGHDAYTHQHTFLLLLAALATGAGIAAWAAAQGALIRQDHAAALVGVAILVPVLSWTVMYLWVGHSSLPGEDGGTVAMFVPGVDPVVDELQASIIWKSPVPRVFDGDGNLVFHPDYGRCDIEPSPCPPDAAA